MTKNATNRMSEIWDYIGSRPRGSRLAIKAIKDAIASCGATEDGLSKHLHLGWWVTGGSAEKKRRVAVRTATLLDILQLKLSTDRIARHLAVNYGRPQTELDSNIDAALAYFNERSR